MDKETYLEKLREQIEINKKNAIEEIQKERMIPAMWDISTLIDLKAQESVLKKFKEEVMRDIFEVLEQIKKVLGEDNEYSEMKSGIEDIEYALRFKAPEDQWNYVYDKFIENFIPPQTEIDYKVLSIWTTKSVEDLKKD